MEKLEKILKNDFKDYNLVDRILQNAIFFGDIIFLDNLSVQKLIKENREILVEALAYAEELAKEKIFRNVSKSEREKIQAQLSSGTGIDRATSFNCQRVFVKCIRELGEAGKIQYEELYLSKLK